MSRTTNLLAGFVTGAVAAGVAVLLTTPASGKEMRQKAKEELANFDETCAEFQTNICCLIDSLKDLTVASIEKIGPFIVEVREAIEQWNRAIEPHQSEIKQQIEELENSLERLEGLLSKS